MSQNRTETTAFELPGAFLPEKVTIEGGRLRRAPLLGNAQVIEDSVGAWNRITALGAQSLRDGKQNEVYLECLGGVLQLTVMRAGGDDMIEKVKRPPNGVKLPLAAGSLVKHWDALKSMLPLTVQGISLDSLIKLLGQLEFVGALRGLLRSADQKLEALQSQIECGLDQPVRTIAARGGALFSQHPDLAVFLAPLLDYISEPSVKGAETKKLKRSVAEEATQDTIDKINEEQAAQPRDAEPAGPPIRVNPPVVSAIVSKPASPPANKTPSKRGRS